MPCKKEVTANTFFSTDEAKRVKNKKKKGTTKHGQIDSYIGIAPKHLLLIIYKPRQR